MVLVRDGKRRQVEDAITKQGGVILQYKFSEGGLRTRTIH